jgi:hypothetical protein
VFRALPTVPMIIGRSYGRGASTVYSPNVAYRRTNSNPRSGFHLAPTKVAFHGPL